ncbi:MAG: hypothetical protein ACK4ZM_03615 [bacterium]
MIKFLEIEKLIEEIEIEFERFKRYNSPLSIVIFSIEFLTKEMQLNYLHKVLFELRKLLEKIARKTDILSRNRNSILVVLTNTDLEKTQGFINRVFNSLDNYIKSNYKADNDKVVLIDAVINISLIYFSDFLPEGYDNVVIINKFEKDSFLEILNNIPSVFEKWEVRIPLVDDI